MGSLSRAEVAQVIRRHLPRIKKCYESELSAHPKLKGKVTAKFVVSPSGRVKKTKILASTMNHPPTERCINETIRQMVFPKPRGGGIVRIRYPFRFSRRAPKIVKPRPTGRLKRGVGLITAGGLLAVFGALFKELEGLGSPLRSSRSTTGAGHYMFVGGLVTVGLGTGMLVVDALSD
jgi:TonB family protein